LRIILASGSPRRQQLLSQIGISFEIIVSDADENIEGPVHNQVEALAKRKALAVKPQVSGEAVIIAADTLVSVDGRVLSKPADKEDAFAILNVLQGRKHTVYTGVALIKGKTLHSFVDAADVYFRPLCNKEITGYINTGEPFDKAGAYGVQGRGAVLIERIEGDFYTVMGLPLSRLCVALGEMGVDIWW